MRTEFRVRSSEFGVRSSGGSSEFQFRVPELFRKMAEGSLLDEFLNLVNGEKEVNSIDAAKRLGRDHQEIIGMRTNSP